MAARKKELPAKETALFKQILVCLHFFKYEIGRWCSSRIVQRQYEFKQYKKGLKAAEQILKKFPEHGGWVILFGVSIGG